ASDLQLIIVIGSSDRGVHPRPLVVRLTPTTRGKFLNGERTRRTDRPPGPVSSHLPSMLAEWHVLTSFRSYPKFPRMPSSTCSTRIPDQSYTSAGARSPRAADPAARGGARARSPRAADPAARWGAGARSPRAADPAARWGAGARSPKAADPAARWGAGARSPKAADPAVRWGAGARSLKAADL